MTTQERDKLRELAQSDKKGGHFTSSIDPTYLLALLDRVDELEARESTPASAVPNPRELWEEAQLWPGEEIEDGVARVKALLSAYYSATSAGGGK